MDKSNFNALMERYLEGKASAQEIIKIEAWLDVMKTKNTTDLELSKEDEERLFKKITSTTTNLNEITSFIPGNKKNFNRWAVQIAAAIAILMTASYLIWTSNLLQPKQNGLTSQGEIEKIILQDGTLVWLRKGASLIYFEQIQNGTRNTELKGEALFEVAKDAAHPFIIKCDKVSLTVLGTSFSVKTTSAGLELMVLTGKVNVSSSTKNINMDVEANEKIIVENNTIEESQIKNTDISDITANTEYNMQFENATMKEVARKISTKFNVPVIVSNELTNKCRITANFTDHSLDRTLQLITEILNVEFARKDDTIIITGKGCD